jgi:hypothetical protein
MNEQDELLVDLGDAKEETRQVGDGEIDDNATAPYGDRL